jgi:hypothetical protein
MERLVLIWICLSKSGLSVNNFFVILVSDSGSSAWLLLKVSMRGCSSMILTRLFSSISSVKMELTLMCETWGLFQESV